MGEVGKRYQWEWCELGCICLMALHVFGEAEGCEGWGRCCGFCGRHCVLSEVPAQESGWDVLDWLCNILGCPGEAAELISSAPGTKSASQLSSSHAELQGGHEVRHV